MNVSAKQEHKGTSEMIGMPYGTYHHISGKLTGRDWNKVTNSRKSLDTATSSIKLNLYNNGARTVALVTTSDSSDLRDWRMIKCDDPAVATFVERLIEATQE